MKLFFPIAVLALALSACVESNAGKNIVVQVNTTNGTATTITPSSPPTLATPQPVATPTPDPKEVARKQIEQLIREATRAVNNEDIDGLISSYHPSSPELMIYQQMKATGTPMATQYENESVEVLGISDDIATARVRRRVTTLLGSFTQNVLGTFKKINDRWSIYLVETTSVESDEEF